jgi:hypothetical protein
MQIKGIDIHLTLQLNCNETETQSIARATCSPVPFLFFKTFDFEVSKNSEKNTAT